jgi:hypothetical protein
MIDFVQLSSGVAMTKRIGLDSLADRGNGQNAQLSIQQVVFHAAKPLALVTLPKLDYVMRRFLLNQVSQRHR